MATTAAAVAVAIVIVGYGQKERRRRRRRSTWGFTKKGRRSLPTHFAGAGATDNTVSNWIKENMDCVGGGSFDGRNACVLTGICRAEKMCGVSLEL